MTFLPWPGGCGRKVRIEDRDVQDGAPHCDSCVALVKTQVERHAALWAPILMASLAMTGRWPEIDPSLLRSA